MKYSIFLIACLVSHLSVAIEVFKTEHFVMECDSKAYTANVFKLSDLSFVTQIKLLDQFHDTFWINGADEGVLTHQERLEIYLFSLDWVRELHATSPKWQKISKITFNPITIPLDFFSYLSKTEYRFIAGGVFSFKDINGKSFPVWKYQPDLSR